MSRPRPGTHAVDERTGGKYEERVDEAEEAATEHTSGGADPQDPPAGS